MCSVTFWPKSDGRYLIGMNRDEQRVRVPGLSPERSRLGDRRVVRPSEPGGGTWILLNDRGVSFALINWYGVEASRRPDGISRGTVIPSVGDCGDPDAADARLRPALLRGIRSFRCVGFFPQARLVREWRWNQSEPDARDFSWTAGQWLSSGFDEAGAQRIRSGRFRAFCTMPAAGSSGWMRRLHGDHDAGPGPYSTCMHRAEAATVSYTEIEAGPGGGVMRHHAGPLCRWEGGPLPELSVGGGWVRGGECENRRERIPQT